MKRLEIDRSYLLQTLLKLLEVPSPSGYTDSIVHLVGDMLGELGVPFELTRRGAIRANLDGRVSSPDRALVAHLDTLGAMVSYLKPNGRLGVCPIGTWSSRFAEGARVTVCTDTLGYRGTILPLRASGHVYGDEIDQQPAGWDNVEIRVDERAESEEELRDLGIQVGDYVMVDAQPEVTESGYIAARHLDDKGGVACLLAAAAALTESGVELPVDCHLLFTIHEEVGSGASAILHQDVAEMVSIDNATVAPGQNSSEHEVNIAMLDGSGPYDWHLTRRLIELCDGFEIPVRREVFRNYRSDAATAVEAGNDIRTALACFGVDGSHGWERTHIDGLLQLAQLVAVYAQSEPVVARDRVSLGPPEGFPEQPIEKPRLVEP
ncbi:MAG: osmoprotectant NAGGN system M42 family peptidase [Gemmatimonadetes bacterium]|uniref:Osmoprotectant NAGGN system M42 family peptidase n=1 Tax=Candidatus Kutchimonas denitrificans TaxID=3056748 RepID=A0AAE4ZB89_9BACT|nr:osmoprotectant NAGGN system M42 family peptidase [Gemmatimonadota bacterium]NIR74260.1 osmoprotectant NAGGN system M42 family peptidase [Candidatus Kutchimonas denitrificans]NIS02515.1 osmoprotectant NAGGN system M42 family peptidase [Gemmatimonadota bacterium]NIT68391.1 osmoprotectant NAGGN system M42 family peptidase [Gemmatimonadota bacterium]NIU51843.1 osmoprotectant NAGGN system M42 family peptidase [Gemmatimonadota bacterium]